MVQGSMFQVQRSLASFPVKSPSKSVCVDCSGKPVIESAHMTEFIVILVTAGSTEEAERLAHELVENRLAACVNRIPSVQSIYRWEGRIETSQEELLVIKTRQDLFPTVEKRVREIHSYSVPEIIALPLIAGSDPYLQWLRDQLPVGES